MLIYKISRSTLIVDPFINQICNVRPFLRQTVKRLRGRVLIEQAIQPRQGTNLDRPTRKLQFSKERLTDFGELPRGEIPEALEYNPISKVSTTDNGVTVGTEIYGSDLAT